MTATRTCSFLSRRRAHARQAVMRLFLLSGKNLFTPLLLPNSVNRFSPQSEEAKGCPGPASLALKASTRRSRPQVTPCSDAPPPFHPWLCFLCCRRQSSCLSEGGAFETPSTCTRQRGAGRGHTRSARGHAPPPGRTPAALPGLTGLLCCDVCSWQSRA